MERLALSLMLLLAACNQKSSATDRGVMTDRGVTTDRSPAIPDGAIQTTVGAAGGRLTSADGALVIDVPAGALDHEVALWVAPVASPPAGAVGTVYEIGPSGTVFAKPATITIKVDGVDTFWRLLVATYDESLGQWTMLSAAWPDPATQSAGGTTLHLSKFGLIDPTKSTTGGGEWKCSQGIAGTCPAGTYIARRHCLVDYVYNYACPTGWFEDLCLPLANEILSCDGGFSCPTGYTLVQSYGISVDCGACVIFLGVQGLNRHLCRKCDKTNCTGCCDASGKCQPGTAAAACGSGGAACAVCQAPTPNCAGQVCKGDCDASTCPTGCCDASGKCQPGSDVSACGSGGAACAVCQGATPLCAAIGPAISCQASSPFAGIWTGTYSGIVPGSWTAGIENDGSLICFFTVPNTYEAVGGQVDALGAMTTLPGSSSLQWTGTFTSNSASGTYTGTYAGIPVSGAWKGTLNGPGNPFRGSWAGTFAGLAPGTWHAQVDIFGHAWGYYGVTGSSVTKNFQPGASVSQAGAISASVDLGSPPLCAWQGTLNLDQTASGTWCMGTWSGNWTNGDPVGQCGCPASICPPAP